MSHRRTASLFRWLRVLSVSAVYLCASCIAPAPDESRRNMRQCGKTVIVSKSLNEEECEIALLLARAYVYRHLSDQREKGHASEADVDVREDEDGIIHVLASVTTDRDHDAPVPSDTEITTHGRLFADYHKCFLRSRTGGIHIGFFHKDSGLNWRDGVFPVGGYPDFFSVLVDPEAGNVSHEASQM